MTYALNKTYKEIKQAFLSGKLILINIENTQDYQSIVGINKESESNCLITLVDLYNDSSNVYAYRCDNENSYPQHTFLD